MEFFSEIYGCYYKIVAEILNRSHTDTVSRQEIMEITERLGFAESGLTIPDKLCSGQWPLLEKTNVNQYTSRLENCPHMPLTILQKRWLKSLFSDSRVSLFLDDDALSEVKEAFSDVDPLWDQEMLFYYDRFGHGDDFSSQEYRQSFRQTVEAVRSGRQISFDYTSAKGKNTRKTCLPLKLEYSPKNDRFRLIALRCPFHKRLFLDHYRMAGMKNVVLSEHCQENVADALPDENSMKKAASSYLDLLMRQSYDTDPVRLLIHNRRNALERAMLHFANYDKDTRQLDDDTWECCIYYDSSMETELLIEILSFGPVVQVVGPDNFVNLIRERLLMQYRLNAVV